MTPRPGRVTGTSDGSGRYTRGGTREIGLWIRFGKLVPGRERRAIELFEEGTSYFRDLYAKKVLTYFEPYFLMTSDYEAETGFFILKARPPRSSS
jgi:hypothetical protein